jgi:hypothetical protein
VINEAKVRWDTLTAAYIDVRHLVDIGPSNEDFKANLADVAEGMFSALSDPDDKRLASLMKEDLKP